ATQDRADQRQAERNKECSGKYSGDTGKGSIQSAYQVDQPDDVRFPDGPYRLGNELPLGLCFGAGARGEKIPDTASEVSAAKGSIDDDGQPQEDHGDIICYHLVPTSSLCWPSPSINAGHLVSGFGRCASRTSST